MSEQAVFDALKYRVEIDKFGTRRYYNSANQLHRDDGPAVIRWSGTKEWRQNGQLHRTSGAAIEYADGDGWWYINGVRMTEDEFNQAISQTKCLK